MDVELLTQLVDRSRPGHVDCIASLLMVHLSVPESWYGCFGP
jgi:hypothetical protein